MTQGEVSEVAFPASKKKIERAGQRIADGVGTPDDEALFDETLDAYDQLRHIVWHRLEAIPWAKAIGRGSEIQITSRTKTRATLLAKLQRQPHIKLPAVRDVCGARIVADVNLYGQDIIAHSIEEVGLLDSLKRIDRRSDPIKGYRALHVTGTIESMHVEVQIRTLLQAAWANLYESLGDRWGRDIRYGESDDTRLLTAAPEGGWTIETGRARILHMLRYVSIRAIAGIEEEDQNRVSMLTSSLGLPTSAEPRLRQAFRDRRLVSRYERLAPLIGQVNERIEKVRDDLAAILNDIEASGRKLS